MSGVEYLVAVCVRFPCTISAQCLDSIFNNSHIPEKLNTCSTRRCVSNRPPVNVSVCLYLFMNVCMCLCVYAWGQRGTEMLVYPSAFVVMFLRTFMTFVNTLLKCHSPGCAYSLRDAYNVHHTSHYSQLESVRDSNWKNRLFKWKSRELKLKKGTLILDLLNCI